MVALGQTVPFGQSAILPDTESVSQSVSESVGRFVGQLVGQVLIYLVQVGH